MEAVLKNCRDFCETFGRQPYFYLTGGDPILHPEFWTLMEMFKAEQIPFTIMGNPFHLTDEVCQRLHDYGCLRYQLSIDGIEETHDWFRKPGSYKTTLEKVTLLNKAGIRSIIERIRNGFYDAPTVCVIFGQRGFPFNVADAFCIAENMVLEAHALGVASCIISRAEETFALPEGKAFMEEWGVPEDMEGKAFVILGYHEGDYPQGKPRKLCGNIVIA
jgi:hypothetical protein